MPARQIPASLPSGPPFYSGGPGPEPWREPAPWWLPEDARGLAVEWGSVRQFSALDAAGADQVTIQFSNNWAFAILSAQRECRDRADQSQVVAPNALVQITAGIGDTNLFNGALHIETVFGTGQRPFYWQVARIIAPGTTLVISLQSLEPGPPTPGVDYDLYLTFSGFRIMGYQP